MDFGFNNFNLPRHNYICIEERWAAVRCAKISKLIKKGAKICEELSTYRFSWINSRTTTATVAVLA